MKNALFLVLGISLILSGAAIAEEQKTTAPKVEFYLVAKGNMHLDKLELTEEPFLTDQDIISYNWQKHSLKIKPAAIAKLPKVKTKPEPFVVVVNDKRCYRGAFLNSKYKGFCMVPVILADKARSGKITIYPSFPIGTKMEIAVDGKKATPRDPRNNPTLKKALKASNKLK